LTTTCATALASNNTARRAIARAWNACTSAVQGWPAIQLIEPPVKALEGPPWEEFPAGLRNDIEGYLSYLTKFRRTAKGRVRPCKPATIKTRRAELIAFVRMAVRLGIPLESLAGAGVLLHPDVVVLVIDAYWKQDGAEPRVYTIDLCSKILAVARERGCLDDVARERLEELRADLEEFRQDGLTPKNLDLVRQVLSENVWGEVVNLPAALMKSARALKDQAPVKAALMAQIAVAVAILTVAPVRLGNLVRTRLDVNLTKPGRIDEPYWLVFPHYDVKNRETLQFPLDQALSDLIDEYIHDFRPVLLRGSNEAWLFPGESGDFKTSNMFSTQITERVQKAIGLRITVHQFRHAAAAIFLKHRPGEYEIVRRLLGHRSIQTTIRFYCGLETIQASRIYGEIMRKLSFEPEPA
jgi:integrase